MASAMSSVTEECTRREFAVVLYDQKTNYETVTYAALIFDHNKGTPRRH